MIKWKTCLAVFFLASVSVLSIRPATSADFYVLTVHELNGGLHKAVNLTQKGFVLIDVRTSDEHRMGFIPGTDMNIDFREVGTRHQEIGVHLSEHIVVYCQSGHRSQIAAHTLADLGYQHVYNVAGSMNAWTEAGYPVQTVRR